jgi:hypothetical protein
MNDADIQVILSGHQPQGDLPTPIRIGHDKLIMACEHQLLRRYAVVGKCPSTHWWVDEDQCLSVKC